MLVGEGAVFGEAEREVAKAARFGKANGDAGAFADLVRGQGLGLAETDK